MTLPVLGEIVCEEGRHLIVTDRPVEAPHETLLLHGEVKDGRVQRIVLFLKYFEKFVICEILIEPDEQKEMSSDTPFNDANRIDTLVSK